MSSQQLYFENANSPGFHLRSIEEKDLEDLRIWKNKNKAFFFLKADISREQQEQWYRQFLLRNEDYMFIAEEEIKGVVVKIGCMGFRLLAEENTVDAYNIMRFDKIEGMTHSMGKVFQTMLKYAHEKFSGLPVSVKVIKSNPAINWYTDKIGFHLVAEREGYNYYELDNNFINNIILK